MPPRRPIGGGFNPPRRNNNFSRRNSSNGLIGGLGALVGTALGSAIGEAVGEAVKPAVNNIGNSVANSIKENAGTATKSIVSIADSQKKIANKKETISYVYFEECPNCGAPREGDNKECEYCGASLVQNTETKIE